MNSISSQLQSISKERNRVLTSTHDIDIETIGDMTFPLFHHMFQICKLNSFFYMLTICLFSFQNIYLSTWPMSNYWKTQMKDIDSKIFQWLHRLTMFMNYPYNDKESLIKELIFLGINLILLILVSTQIIYYRLHKRFINAMIAIFQLICLFPIVLILPTTYDICVILSMIMHGKSSVYAIITMILCILNISIDLIHHYLFTNLFQKNIIIRNYPFMSFSQSLFYKQIWITIICYILTYIFAYFASWSFIIPLLFHFAFFCYFTFQMKNIYFFNIYYQAFLISSLTTVSLTDIVAIVLYFISTLSTTKMLPYIFALVSLIVNYFLGLTYCYLKQRHILKCLNCEISDGVEYFDNLRIMRSENFCLMFLTQGFTNGCSLFCNMALYEYILSKNPSTNILSYMLQIISQFPGELRCLNQILMLVQSKETKKDLATRFLLYQVNRIKKLREESTTSNELLARIADMRSMERQMESLTRYAFELETLNQDYYEDLSLRIRRARALWAETIEEFPNQLELYNLYLRYLVEVENEFDQAIQIKRKCNMIEMGMSSTHDPLFRSFLQNFQNFVKKNLVDSHGNLTKKSITCVDSNSFINDGSESDDEQVEILIKQTIKNSTLRMAFFRSFRDFYPKSIKIIFPLISSYMILAYFLYTIILLLSKNKLADQKDSMKILDAISKTRFFIGVNDMEILLRFTKDRGTFSNYEGTIIKIQKNCTTNDIVTDFNKDFLEQSMPNLQNAMSSYSLMLELLAELANKGFDIKKMIRNLAFNNHQIYTCYEGDPIYYINDSVMQMINIFFAHQSFIIIRRNENISDMYGIYQFCELISNLRTFYSVVYDVFSDFCTFQIDIGEKTEKTFLILTYIFPIIIALITIIPLIVVNIFVVRSMSAISKIIIEIDHDVRLKAKELILNDKDMEDDGKLMSESVKQTRSKFISVVLIFMSLFAVAAMIIITLLAVRSTRNIVNLNKWDQFATLRLSLTSELLNSLTFGISIHDNPTATNISTPKKAVGMIESLIAELKSANENLVSGSSFSPACVGFDEELDIENIIDEKINSSDKFDLHYLYEKSSINTQIRYLIDFVTTLNSEIITPRKLSVEETAQSYHLFSSHLAPKMLKVTKRLMNLASLEYDKVLMIIEIVYALCYFAGFIYILIVWLFYKNRKETFKSAMSILLRIDPISLISNKTFMKNFLAGSLVKEDERKKLNWSANLIYDISDAVFVTNIHGVVEFINPAATEILGYTPEQLLGQSVASFVVQTEKDNILSNMEKLTKQEIESYEENITFLTDSNVLVPCRLTIVYDGKGLIFIVKDNTLNASLEEQIEEVKKKSQSLINQVIPPLILAKFNDNEGAFTTNKSTAGFIDIVSFNKLVTTMTPQDILRTLTYVFGVIDQIIVSYPCLSKIKVDGDAFLFTSSVIREDFTEEYCAQSSVFYALDVIRELEDANGFLGKSIIVRAGIACGGRMIVCLLDGGNLEVIGEVVDTAKILQKTCEKNKIHVSYKMYSLIAGSNFQFQKRNDVEFFGKGIQETYSVSEMTQYGYY